MHPTLTLGLLFLVRKRVTLESSVAGSILLGFESNDDHNKYWNNRSWLRHMIIGKACAIQSDFSTVLSRVDGVLGSSSRGTKDLGFRWKWSLVTEGYLLIYVSFFCSPDYLQITDEMNRVFGKYCGHMTGKTLLVSGKYALIKFHSNRNIQNRRFLISFTSCKKW